MYQHHLTTQQPATTKINNNNNFSNHTQQQRRQEHCGQGSAAMKQHHLSTKSADMANKSAADAMFDSNSVSSEDLEHFLPRIIRPRRRRKKDRKEKALQNQDDKQTDKQATKGQGKEAKTKVKGSTNAEGQQVEGEEPEMLGSEKQWLPQGLLSAESSYDSRSESGSSIEETILASGHRKLSAALSMPVYPSYAAPIYFNPINKPSETSDYSSLTSNSSEYQSSNSNSSDTHTSDNQCDSDSRSEANSTPSFEVEEEGGEAKQSTSDKQKTQDKHVNKQDKPILVKSTSSSFFRSPKMSGRHETYSPTELRKRNLRKTNSWHPNTHQDDSMATFSLFSPAGSIDLLSGIRKNLSKLDVNSETE